MTWEMIVLGMVRTTWIMAAGLLSAAPLYAGGCCSDMLLLVAVCLLVDIGLLLGYCCLLLGGVR